MREVVKVVTYLIEREDLQLVFINEAIRILKRGTDERKTIVRDFMNDYGAGYMNRLSDYQISQLFYRVIELDMRVVDNIKHEEGKHVRTN